MQVEVSIADSSQMQLLHHLKNYDNKETLNPSLHASDVIPEQNIKKHLTATLEDVIDEGSYLREKEESVGSEEPKSLLARPK